MNIFYMHIMSHYIVHVRLGEHILSLLKQAESLDWADDEVQAVQDQISLPSIMSRQQLHSTSSTNISGLASSVSSSNIAVKAEPGHSEHSVRRVSEYFM
jgi:ribosomal protein S2